MLDKIKYINVIKDTEVVHPEHTKVTIAPGINVLPGQNVWREKVRRSAD